MSRRNKSTSLVGLIKRHPDGFGFFIPDSKDHPDVYIPKQNMKGVFTNDRVRVEAFPEGKGDRFRGDVTEILEKGTRKVAGTLVRLNDKYAMIRDDAGSWGEDLKIPWEDTNNAGIGKLVTAEITQYPSDKDKFLGKVLDVLGDIADPLNDIKRVIAIQQIPDVFPDEAIDQVKNLDTNPSEKEFAGRKDLRGKNLITIDGRTAKDFDDAILVERTTRGFKLYVAIADVSHYVKPGTPVDQEAYLRGNSVYFPNFVVPMLPEILSNHLCSLNPKVPRLCVVAEMDFDFQGVKTDAVFYEAVMESKARVTYGEAQEIIDGSDIEQFMHVKDNILLAADLAKVFMAKRQREGSLDLEIPETELVIDAKGEPIDVIRSERLFSHKLIEEMMLAANVAVAEFLSAQEVAAIYRIHEPPFEDNVAKLQNFIHSFGGKTKLDQGQLQKRLSAALQEFEGTPQAHAIHTLTLRSMNQAKYSAENVGHFGLGFGHYTHFTSPIRRYSDLIVHRLLKSFVVKNNQYGLIAEDELATAGTHLSATEQKAAKSERLIKAIKKARFLSKYLGEEFDGLISSVTKFGVFVVLREYDIDGLVRLEDLSKEHLEFDEENMILFGKRSGVKFQIGDEIKIIVSSVDIEMGQINFVIEKGARSSAGNASAGKSPKFYAPTKDSRRSKKSRGKSESRDDRKNRFSKDKSREEREDRRDFKKKKYPARPARQEERFSKPVESAMEANRNERREGGLSPNQVEEKLRKLRADPRFQVKRMDQRGSGERSESSEHRGGGRPGKNLFSKIKAGRDKDNRNKERDNGSSSDKPHRKDSQKRGSTKNDRGGIRKARPSKRR